MSDLSKIQIENLFDRLPRTHASCIRRSRVRTFCTFFLLILFVLLIGGYVFVTDPERVRRISEHYLSDLAGGPVHVKQASLSIFEGLKLDDIRIDTDSRRNDDSLLFEAKSLHIGYSPRALLMGKIEATRILALEPRVHLVENVDQQAWNFQHLERPAPQPPKTPAAEPAEPIKLPEILLRNARIDYAQIVDGRRSQVGTLNIEGQLTPDLENVYRFRIQSRGGTSGVFPIAEGWLQPGGKQLGVVLRDVEFVDEIKTILPAVVRRFWEEHALAGRIGETRISYFTKGARAGFRVETDLDGVRLTIPPERYLGPEERVRIDTWDRTMTRIGSPALGNSALARLMVGKMMPGPLQLDEVDGTFVFTDEKVEINSLVARIESSRFSLAGEMLGYAPTSPFKVKVQSLKSENIHIPAAPTYINSMPWPVQEIYYRFRPRGECSFWLTMERTAASERPVLAGEVKIHDAAFQFERVPYPIERASGVIRLGNDPTTGREMLEIVSLAGQGYAGGGNEKATVEMVGKITPLDDTASADIVVRGRGIVSTREMIACLPPETRRTVTNFDPQKTGKLPFFTADFDCSIQRPIGLKKPWTIVTRVDVQKATGMLAAFPIALKDLDATLVVHDKFIDLERAVMPRGGGSVELSGRIDWTKRDAKGEVLVQPDLKLVVKDVPIDDELVAALPANRRALAEKTKLRGRIDIEGKIIPENPESDDISLDVALTLKDGAATLGDGSLKLTSIAADARIRPEQTTISALKARLGEATVDARATIDWKEDVSQTAATAQVRGLAVDEALLAALPAESREAIAALSPKGTVDLDIDYAAAEGDGNYRVAVRPRELSIKPKQMPITLSKLQGEVIVDRGHVTLKDVVAGAGDAKVYVSGTIDPKAGSAEVSLSGRDLKITDEFRKSLPPTMQRLLSSADLKGTVAFDLNKLVITPDPKQKNPSDITFDATLWLQNATMDIGTPMTDINGVLRAKGVARGGKLSELAGDVSFDSLKLAGRSVDRLTAAIVKPANQDVLQVAKIDGRIGDGQIGGQIDSILSEKDPRFGLALVLRNARVADLTGDIDKPIEGRLTASLALEGKWDDPSSRRGRGDVIVDGKDMYRVPVLFGLMQIANLTLPLDAPIQQAGVRYTVEGNRVALEAIDLRSRTSVMQGTGWLDFKTRQVQMTLLLGNSAADAVPIFGELLKGARQDLLQIRVRGSIEEPKVGASAFNTITTTVDEVLKGRD